MRRKSTASSGGGTGAICATLGVAVVFGMAGWVLREPAWAALRDHPYFALERLVVRGSGPLLSEAEVRGWLELGAASSVWELDPGKIEERLEAHPMIDHARVRRRFPDRFEIRVRERQPAAIVVLDDLYYLDRGGQLFGPVVSGHSLDYPVITGLTEDAAAGYRMWALRRVLHLLRRCRRRSSFSELSGIHLDPQRGVILYPTAPRVPVILGWKNWPTRLERAERAVRAWAGGAERMASVDVRFRDQVVVARRAPAGAERSFPERGLSHGAGDG